MVRLLRLALVLCLGCVALLLSGCTEHLAGTHDVALIYRIDAAASDDQAAVVKLVKRRLGAAHIAADVHPTAQDAPDDDPIADVSNQLTVLVDDSEVDLVKAYLAWRGGVLLMRPDPKAGDPLYKGSPTEAAARATDAKVDAQHLVLMQLIDDKTAEVRVVERAPALDASAAIDSAEALHGNVIDLTTTEAIRTELSPLVPALTSGALLLVRGQSVLPLADAPSPSETSTADHLYVAFPASLVGYARAHASMLLLQTPVLPVLTPLSAARAPVDRLLATGCLVVPFVLSALWLLFVRRFDRAEPEPLWLVGATFLLGCLSVIPAGLAEYGLARATPWLNPTYATMGAQLVALPFSILVFSLVVGVSEEGAKLLGAWSLAGHRREFDEPVDGIIYAAASALGFAAVENVKYFAIGRLSAALIVARTFMSIPAHLLFASLWGYGMGKRIALRRTRVWPWFVLAALLHGSFDTFLSYGSLGVLSVILEGSMALVFIVLLRKALRYGPTDPSLAEIPDDQRDVLMMGAPGYFAAATVAFVSSMFPLAILAGMLESQHPRSVFPWLFAGSVLVLLSGLCAYAVSATVPLDVVLDANGITFAGARRNWATVRGLRPLPTRRRYARLASSDGDLYIGPSDPRTLTLLHELVEKRRSAGA